MIDILFYLKCLNSKSLEAISLAIFKNNETILKMFNNFLFNYNYIKKKVTVSQKLTKIRSIIYKKIK